MRIVLWCNGSTTGFGSVCLGSNPGRTTQKAMFKGLGIKRHHPMPLDFFLFALDAFLPKNMFYNINCQKT